MEEKYLYSVVFYVADQAVGVTMTKTNVGTRLNVLFVTVSPLTSSFDQTKSVAALTTCINNFKVNNNTCLSEVAKKHLLALIEIYIEELNSNKPIKDIIISYNNEYIMDIKSLTKIN